MGQDCWPPLGRWAKGLGPEQTVESLSRAVTQVQASALSNAAGGPLALVISSPAGTVKVTSTRALNLASPELETLISYLP